MADNLIKNVKIKDNNNTEIIYKIDASILDGQASNYYAKAIDINDLQSKVNSLETDLSNEITNRTTGDTNTLSSAKSYTNTKTSDMLTKTVASSTYQPKGDYITKDKFTLDGTVLTIDLD